MSNEVVLSNLGLPSQHEMEVFRTMAKGAVSSGMYKGSEHGVIMIMLAARELGIPPMAALNGGLHIIQGKVEISARMMSALIRRGGHDLMVKESTDEKCVLVGTRKDNGNSFEASYTINDAQKAGLVKSGGGWAKFPKDMCFARALSRLARQLFSDVIGIGYVEGEIFDKTNDKQDEKEQALEGEHKQITIQSEENPEITDEMEKEFIGLLSQCEEKTKEKLESYVMNKLGANSIKDINYNDYMFLLTRLKKHLEENKLKEVTDVGTGDEGIDPAV